MEENLDIQSAGNIGEEKPQMNLIARLIGVFTEPKRTFQALAEKPDFILPLIIVMLAAFLSTLAALPIIQRDSAEIARERMFERGMTQEQVDAFAEQQEKIGAVSSLAGAPFSSLFITFVASGLLLFAGNVVMGGNANYKQMLCVFSYASLIGIISFAVRAVLMLSKDSIWVYTSLAALFPPDMKNDLIFRIAGIFDIFVIWKIIVVAIGMGVMYKVETRKPLIIISILYLIFAAVTTAMTPKF